MNHNFFNLQRDSDADIFAGATISVNNKEGEDDIQDDFQEEEQQVIPEEKIEQKEEVPVVEEKKTEPTVEVPPIVEPVKDWRETATIDEIVEFAKSKADRTALLKAAGVDEETIKAIDFKEANGGKWDEYLSVKNTDYTKYSPEKLIELGLKEKYKNLDERQFGVILKSELSKYHLNRELYDEDSDEAVLGNIMLKEDSDLILSKFIERQEGLKAPEKQSDTKAKELETLSVKITDDFKNSQPVKELVSSKLISFGKGDESFNYEPKDIDMLVSSAVASAVQQGQVPSNEEIAKTIKVLAYLFDPEGIENALINQGKEINSKSVRAEAVNPLKKEESSQQQYGVFDPHAAFETNGRIVSH